MSDAALRELQALLDVEVERLPEKYRAPFVLCCLEGRSKVEAARELGWKEGTVSSRLAHARNVLQERLSRRGVTLSAALTAVGLSAGTASAMVPPLLAATTIKAAMAFAASPAAAVGLASAKALLLAKSTLQSMALAPVKMAMALVTVACLAATGAGLAHQALSANMAKPPLARAGDRKLQNKPRSQPAEQKPVLTDAHGDPLPPGALARMGTVRFRHGNSIQSVAFSPDGATVASGSDHEALRLWDRATGKEVSRAEGFLSGISSLAFSPNGKTIVTGGLDGRTQLWRVIPKGKLESIWDRVAGAQVAIAPDGKSIASGGWPDPKTILLLNADSGRVLLRFLGHTDTIISVAFSPSGKILASCSGDQTIRLWDPATAKELTRIGPFADGISSLAFSPDGETLASANEDGVVGLWNGATGKPLRRIVTGRGMVRSVAFSPDGKVLASASGRDPTIRLWEVATGKEPRNLRAAGVVAFSPDGKTLAVAGTALRFWNIATGKELEFSGGHQDGLQALALSPNGKTLATATYEDAVRLWDAATGRELRQINGTGGWLTAIGFSPDGKALFSSSLTKTSVPIWEAATGRELRRLDSGGIFTAVLSPDGAVLATGGKDKTIRLLDAQSGREIAQLKGHEHEVHALDFSPDGKVLASAQQARPTIVLWDLATGKEIRRIAGQKYGVRFAIFSPDGRTLASGGIPDSIILWDLATGRELRRFERDPATMRQTRDVIRAAFSPDGRTLASAEADAKIFLWETATGKRRRVLEGHEGVVTAVAFFPDGKRLASASLDTTALVWDIGGSLSAASSIKNDPQQLQAMWSALADDDAGKAYEAVCSLASAATEAVEFFQKRLRPVRHGDPERISRLMADLDSKQFSAREQAVVELAKLRDAAGPALRRVLERRPSLEVRRRVESLLAKLDYAAFPARLQELRTVEVLERVGTPAAVELLKALAEGAPDFRLTQEAKATLDRLAKRTAGTP